MYADPCPVQLIHVILASVCHPAGLQLSFEVKSYKQLVDRLLWKMHIPFCMLAFQQHEAIIAVTFDIQQALKLGKK